MVLELWTKTCTNESCSYFDIYLKNHKTCWTESVIFEFLRISTIRSVHYISHCDCQFWKQSSNLPKTQQLLCAPLKVCDQIHISNPNFSPSNLWFWYHKKAHIFLITPVKSYARNVFCLDGTNKIVPIYYKNVVYHAHIHT